MAALAIHPIHTQSRGGYPVIINGLDPSDHDCLVGEISPLSGRQEARWSLHGIMRGGSDSANLPMDSDDMKELVLLARKLGAPD